MQTIQIQQHKDHQSSLYCSQKEITEDGVTKIGIDFESDR